jgi:hypothetical protein
MRKIFSFFVAVMAVSSLSAKSIYLQVNDDWKSFGAVFFVHSWGGAADADVKLALVEGEEYLFSAEIPNDNNNLLFVRAQGDSQSIPWDTENLWTKTSDLVIPEGKDCYYLVGWTDGAWLSHGDSPAISIVGNFKGDETWGSGAHPMTIAGDKASASVTFALKAGAYEMKVWLEGFYLSLNGEGETLYQIHRDWNHADNVNMVNSGRNFELVADQAGDYTFTWTFASQNIEVNFPEKIPSPVENIQTEGKSVKRIVNGELRIIRDGKTFNALGAEVK